MVPNNSVIKGRIAVMIARMMTRRKINGKEGEIWINKAEINEQKQELKEKMSE